MKFSLVSLSPSNLGPKVRRAGRRLWTDEHGLSTVEYIVLLAVIVVGAIGIWKSIGGNLISSLENAEAELGDL